MAEDRLPILVGVDGSSQSLAAVDLGLRQARLHKRPLRVIHAFVWPLLGVPLGPSPEGPSGGGLAADADRVVVDALAHAASAGPDVETAGEVVTGAVVPVLLAEARRAELVVLGDRGLGGFTGLLVGSVAVQVAAHAPGPVLVARGTLREHGPVVVGVDGSAASAAAVEFAFAEAAARGAALVALHAWYRRLPPETVDELPLIYEPDDVQAAQARQLAASLARARQRFPTVAVHERVRQDRVAHALIEATTDAQLLVVGARGRGGFAGLLLGSVSQAVLHHARCPVAIVRARPGAGPEPAGHAR